MPKLGFSIPFSGFGSTTFINCLASVYLYLEGISAKAGNVTFCNEWENGQCNGCGNCATKPQALQEKYFFLFDTMCGHSSLRCRFDGTPTEMEKLDVYKRQVHKGMQGWVCLDDLSSGALLINFPQCGENEDIATISIKETDMKLIPRMDAKVNERIREAWDEGNPPSES